MLPSYDRFECFQIFCGNPDCVLHVSPGDACVVGNGNWAHLPDGSVIGRGRYAGRMLCDRCGREQSRVTSTQARQTEAGFAPLRAGVQ